MLSCPDALDLTVQGRAAASGVSTTVPAETVKLELTTTRPAAPLPVKVTLPTAAGFIVIFPVPVGVAPIVACAFILLNYLSYQRHKQPIRQNLFPGKRMGYC